MKHGIRQQENSITLIHFICTIFRSAAANISVLASPRMIPICIVAPPLGLYTTALAQRIVLNSCPYQCRPLVDWQGTRPVSGRIEQPAVNRDQLSILIPHTISSTNLLQ